MSGMGHTQEDICAILGLGSTNTLMKHYGIEVRMGRVKANDSVAKSLYKQALDGNTTAGIWWEKTRAGKTDRHEFTGKDGGPIATSNAIDWSKLSDADLEHLTRLLGDKGMAPKAEPDGPAGPGANGANPTRH